MDSVSTKNLQITTKSDKVGRSGSGERGNPELRKQYGTNSTRDNPSEEAAFELGVLYSTVKEHIVAFTAKEGVAYSFADAATRVANLLQSEALRQQYRDSELLPEVRQNGAAYRRGRSPRYRPDELGAAATLPNGASGRRALSKKAINAIKKAQRARWARFHAERAKHGVAVGFEKPAKKKRKFRQTAATRAKISAARKAYWAAKRKGGAAA